MWIHRIRLKALAWLVAVILAAVGAISFFAIPAIPALSVAVAVIAVALNQIGHRLTQPTCYGCGSDLTGRPAGQYGVVCSECGTINQVVARSGDVTARPSGEADEHADEPKQA